LKKGDIMKIGIVCTSFHRKQIERMLAYAKDESNIQDIEIFDIKWVPGAMEIPLTLDRMLSSGNLNAAITLGIIENGETKHGLVMGQAVIKSIIDIQLKYGKPIGLGIIGPGALKEHISPRLEPHARAAVNAIVEMSK